MKKKYKKGDLVRTAARKNTDSESNTYIIWNKEFFTKTKRIKGTRPNHQLYNLLIQEI